MNKPDFRILEGIRGLAAFVVLLNHARGYLFVGGRTYLASHDTLWDKLAIGLFQVTSLGLNAVIVFFVLSGFSIAHSVASGTGTGRFYLRRVIRLVPPGVAGLALALGVRQLVAQPLPYESYIPQYWSLYHEAIFYALAPLVVAIAWRRYFGLAATVGYIAGVAMGMGDILHNFVFQYAFYFAVGVIAYHRRDLLLQMVLARWAFTAACIVGLAVMAATAQTYPRTSSFISAAFSLLLIANFQHHSITNRPLQLLGSMSYTLYVTHFATIVLWSLTLQRAGWIQGRASDSLWLWTTAVPVALLVSYAVYWIVERPAMDLLKKIRSRKAENATAAQLSA